MTDLPSDTLEPAGIDEELKMAAGLSVVWENRFGGGRVPKATTEGFAFGGLDMMELSRAHLDGGRGEGSLQHFGDRDIWLGEL